MPERYWVRLSQENLVFSAAHFITYAGDRCERLHGHNYGVVAHVHGPLDENQYVVDFTALRDALQAVVGELDHRVLLATRHRAIRVTEEAGEVEVRFERRRWVFPREDCALLPVANTTAELLARHIAVRLRERLEPLTGRRLESIRIEVDENHGQWAAYEWTSA